MPPIAGRSPQYCLSGIGSRVNPDSSTRPPGGILYDSGSGASTVAVNKPEEYSHVWLGHTFITIPFFSNLINLRTPMVITWTKRARGASMIWR
jgi:hypothetical protein